MASPELPAITSAVVEGVGSEVVVCFGILLAGLILVVAWLSTYVPQDMRPIAVFVFENFDRARTAVTGASDNHHSEANAVESSAQQQQQQQQPTSTEPNTDTVASDATVEDNQQQQQQAESSESASASAAHNQQRPNLAAYDVDLLDSDGDIDPEIRERVEDVLHEYTQVMEAKSDTELRNRRLKYFNCLIAGDAATAEAGNNNASDNAATTTAAATAATTAAAESVPSEQAADQASTIANSQPVCAEAAAAAAAAVPAVNAHSRPPGSLLLRLKYFNDDLRTVFALPTESIANFKRQHFQPELSRNMNIRLIYNGRELKEGTDRTLASYAIPEEATIHCLVTERTDDTQPQEEASNNLHEGQGDIGNYMFPLFGGILGLIWYCRICYKAYFNFMSTMALGAVTLLFFAAFFASWSARPLRQSGPIHVHRINLDAADNNNRQNARSPS